MPGLAERPAAHRQALHAAGVVLANHGEIAAACARWQQCIAIGRTIPADDLGTHGVPPRTGCGWWRPLVQMPVSRTVDRPARGTIDAGALLIVAAGQRAMHATSPAWRRRSPTAPP